MPPARRKLPKKISRRADYILSLARPDQSQAEHDLIIERFLWLKVHNWRACGKIAKMVHRKAVTSPRMERFYARLIEKQEKKERLSTPGVLFGTRFLGDIQVAVQEQFWADTRPKYNGDLEVYENHDHMRQKANIAAGNVRFIGELSRIDCNQNAISALVRNQLCTLPWIFHSYLANDKDSKRINLLVDLLKKAKELLVQFFKFHPEDFTNFLEWLHDQSSKMKPRARMNIESLIEQLLAEMNSNQLTARSQELMTQFESLFTGSSNTISS